LRIDVHRLSKHASIQQRISIQNRRQKLAKQIDKFHERFDIMVESVQAEDIFITSSIDDDDESAWEPLEGVDVDEEEDGHDEDDDDNDDNDDEGAEAISPENVVLLLPSSLKSSAIQALALSGVALQELELRKGQANDILEKLRYAMGQKSLLFRMNVSTSHQSQQSSPMIQVRNARGNKDITRAYRNVKQVEFKIQTEFQAYRRCRKAMEQLGASQDDLDIYKQLLPGDLKMSDDIIHPNRSGQRLDKLSWFWYTGQQDVHDKNMWMDECMVHLPTHQTYDLHC
jgi:hypothetical protein